MPSSRFKPLSLGSLPRVMVAILAMHREDRDVIALELRKQPIAGLLAGFFMIRNVPITDPNSKNLAWIFDQILQFSKEERGVLVGALNDLLDDLRRNDFFGTEGQLDPRGDHRD